MAQEKVPSPRVRKKKADDADTAVPVKAPAKAAAKVTAAREGAPARPRARRKPATAAPAVTVEAIAFHAYLLWERGEPGGPEEHWFRAEQELVAA